MLSLRSLFLSIVTLSLSFYVTACKTLETEKSEKTRSGVEDGGDQGASAPDNQSTDGDQQAAAQSQGQVQGTTASQAATDAEIGDAGRAFNLLMETFWGDLVAIAEPKLVQMMKDAINETIENNDILTLNKIYEPKITIDSYPGFTEFTDKSATLRIPKSGGWEIDTKVDVKVGVEILDELLEKDFEIHVIVKNLSAAQTFEGDISDITRVKIEDVKKIDVTYDIEISIEHVPPELIDLLMKIFGDKYIEDTLDEWTTDVRNQILENLK